MKHTVCLSMEMVSRNLVRTAFDGLKWKICKVFEVPMYWAGRALQDTYVHHSFLSVWKSLCKYVNIASHIFRHRFLRIESTFFVLRPVHVTLFISI